MPNLSTVTTNFFPTPNEGFITTLSSTILAAATTVPLTTTSGLTNGSIFVGLIEPGQPNEQAFTGVVDTGGTQVTSVKWTKGTNIGHNAGVTIVDYVTSTHFGMVTKGLTQSIFDQDATMKAGAVDNAAAVADGILTPAKFTTALQGDWKVGLLPAVSSVTENGNRSASLTFASTVASILTPGMRIRTSRTVAAPTQCTDLEASSTQYYSKASPNKLTFTDDFVVSAWVKLSAYGAGDTMIATRADGTQGWFFMVNSSGQVILSGANAALANFSRVTSYQSLPLNKWVHVAAQLDMSTFTATTTTSYVMLDGKDVPASVTRGGTNPTALVQAGNLEIGAYNGGLQPLNGKIAQVAIFNAKVTQATMRTYKNQGLSGSETSLASAYSCNNSLLDLNTTTPNDLTASGGALMTNADSPFTVDANGVPHGTYDWAIVTKVATTVATVQYPEGCAIPTSGGISTVDYSGVKAPFGMPTQKNRWQIRSLYFITINRGVSTANTWYNVNTLISVPIGAWAVEYKAYTQNVFTATTFTNTQVTLSTGSSSSTDSSYTSVGQLSSASLTQNDGMHFATGVLDLSAVTIYYLNLLTSTSNTTTLQFASPTTITIDLAYL